MFWMEQSPPSYIGVWPGGEKAALQKRHEGTLVGNLNQSRQCALAAKRPTASWAELAKV